jgi:hypothetical protein
MIILEIYLLIVFSFLALTALLAYEGLEPKEITCLYTWLFYGLLFPIPLIKGLIKFIINIAKL